MNNKMPALFIGHGSPMNTILDNEYSQSWKNIGKEILLANGAPRAILAMSAHWHTSGSTLVSTARNPETIYDFYGFPEELYNINYPAKGAPFLAKQIAECRPPENKNSNTESATTACPFEPSDAWGLDHGTWSVLHHMFPNADIPTFQISVDMNMPLEKIFEQFKRLQGLREEGVLFIGSGNIVHNLGALDPSRNNKPHSWAKEFDENANKAFLVRDKDALSNPNRLGDFKLAHPYDDHYRPLLGTLALADESDEIIATTPTIDLGSIGMRSFIIK